ncbi:hypothetical protein QIH93_21060 [Bradyrhizobium ottawaense]|uniref:hypothetical protein n=1 Tax=Bradyrhizobium ottawaense TaxID=931866 RepID=UPI0027153FEA|nr:hypothetical protein [Bradyrhizobium ottawaense]WLB43040.1 hypothetical protein QIH93_21060 [Bradyrhizobium ottawaense]
MTALVRYEAARRALAEAVAVDEVMAIHDQAEAMRHAMRIAGDKALEIQAAQIRFRAERRLGELIAAQKQTVGLNRGALRRGSQSEQRDERPTLAEVGIDRKLSSKAQRLAAMDAAAFEQAMEEHAKQMRAGVGRIAMDLHKVGAEERGREARRELAIALSAKSSELPSGRKYAVIYADPPWHRDQGVTSRSYENHYPTMAWREICALPVAERVLPDAWLFLWIPRAHAFALHEVETEVEVVETGEIVRAKVMMPLGWAVAQAWGFDAYSTAFVWTKTDEEHPDVGGGAILVRDQDELLLLFKRGNGLPKPEKKFGSNHRERSRPLGHSTKPQHYRRMIAEMAGANVPALEMFARFDPENPAPAGWDLWGNQAGDMSGDNSALAELPSGEAEAVAADATSDRASTAAAVAEPPYNGGDVVIIDQLAGSDWLQSAELDALELSEFEQLSILSDVLHPKRRLQRVLGPVFQRRELAYEAPAGEWGLREAGYARKHELEALEVDPPPALTEPFRAPQMSLFDAAVPLLDRPPPQVIDGALQTRLPTDDVELSWQLALLAVDAGQQIDREQVHDLIGEDLLFATTKKLVITEKGRAFLTQLVAPASTQQLGAGA